MYVASTPVLPGFVRIIQSARVVPVWPVSASSNPWWAFVPSVGFENPFGPWAHARRKFYDAQDSDEERATQMLALIAELYQIERESKELSDALRLAVRQERSVPVLEKIKTWLDAEEEVVLPRSPMATAITYAQNQWQALNTYVTQGFLNIDNNASERALKRVVLGRKNWLFAGNDAAAENHARLWSLIATCERHGVDPQRYLTSVLAKIGTTSSEELAQFLPDVWKAEDAAVPPEGDH